MLVERDKLTGRYVSTETLEERFWEKVDKRGDDECWNWIANKGKTGYGMVWFGKGFLRSNRASWIIHFGNIPKGMLVCHKCDNPSCVNPAHLFLGTSKDNAQDMLSKGRNPNQKGENNGFAKFKDEDILKIREMWKSGKYLQREIMETFGISRNYLWRILYNKGRII